MENTEETQYKGYMQQSNGFNTYVIGVTEKGGGDTLHKNGSMLFSPSLGGTE